DVDPLDCWRQHSQHLRRYEIVVERDVSTLHEFQRAQCQQLGVAGTRADEIDLAARLRGPPLWHSDEKRHVGLARELEKRRGATELDAVDEILLVEFKEIERHLTGNELDAGFQARGAQLLE